MKCTIVGERQNARSSGVGLIVYYQSRCGCLVPSLNLAAGDLGVFQESLEFPRVCKLRQQLCTRVNGTEREHVPL